MCKVRTHITGDNHSLHHNLHHMMDGSTNTPVKEYVQERLVDEPIFSRPLS